MPRQRFIWPTMWSDPALGRLESSQLLLYIGCFSLADDDGRLLGDPAFLRAQVFPYRDFMLDEVLEMRDAVAGASASFCVYEVGGVEYVAFLNWKDFQKPKYPKPSQLPAPPKPKRGKSRESLPEDSPNVPPRLPEASSMGWVGLDRDGEGREGKDIAPTASRPVDAVWDFVVEIEGEPLPRYRKARGRIVADLKQLLDEQDVGEAVRRHEALAREWGDAKATARALVTNWDRAGRMADGLMRPAQPTDGRITPSQIYASTLRPERPCPPERRLELDAG